MVEADGAVGIRIVTFRGEAQVADVFSVPDQRSNALHDVASVDVELLAHDGSLMVLKSGAFQRDGIIDYTIQVFGILVRQSESLDDPELIMEVMEAREALESAETREDVEQVREENQGTTIYVPYTVLY